MNELFAATAVGSWKLIISRLDERLGPLDEEQLQKQVAPGKNRLFYLLGHLTAVHDRMLPLLGIGERLHPELDDAYITNPDRTARNPNILSWHGRLWLIRSTINFVSSAELLPM